MDGDARATRRDGGPARSGTARLYTFTWVDHCTSLDVPWQPLGFGLAFLILGALAIIVSRRVRARA